MEEGVGGEEKKIFFLGYFQLNFANVADKFRVLGAETPAKLQLRTIGDSFHIQFQHKVLKINKTSKKKKIFKMQKKKKKLPNPVKSWSKIIPYENTSAFSE